MEQHFLHNYCDLFQDRNRARIDCINFQTAVNKIIVYKLKQNLELDIFKKNESIEQPNSFEEVDHNINHPISACYHVFIFYM